MAWEEQRTVPGDFKFQLTIYLYFGGIFFSLFQCIHALLKSIVASKKRSLHVLITYISLYIYL